jgi:YcxB-like protein
MDTPPTILPREIKFEWSRDLSQAAARRYFSRRFRRPLIVFSLISAVCVGGLIFDPRKDMAGAYLLPLMICLIPVFLLILVYFKTTRHFEESPDKRITVRVEPESITWESSESVSTMKWSAIKRLWMFPDVLLIFTYKKAQVYSALPVAELGVEVSKTIEDKVRQYGGQVA